MNTDTTTDTPATTVEAGKLRASHRACFACGSRNRHGLHLHFEVDASGVARAEWLPEADFRSYPDRIHGGIIATMLDSAMVHALFARGIAGVTAEMTIRYKNAVRAEEVVHIAGKVERLRHGIYFCHAEVLQDGRPTVTASAKFMTPPEADHHPA